MILQRYTKLKKQSAHGPPVKGKPCRRHGPIILILALLGGILPRFFPGFHHLPNMHVYRMTRIQKA